MKKGKLIEDRVRDMMDKVDRATSIVDKIYKELDAIADEVGIKKEFRCDCGKTFELPSDLLIHRRTCNE